MARVFSFEIPFQNTDSVRLRAHAHESPVFAILVGKNGCKKSLILRQLVLAGLDLNSKREFTGSVAFERRPKAVVAISATATDRFPSRSKRGDLLYQTRFDRDEYVYVGPKSSRNIFSRSHSASELLH